MKNIDFEEFEKIKSEDLELVDVRETDEYDLIRLQGAKHMPLSILPLKLSDIDWSKKVVVYCRTGARSSEAARFLGLQGKEVYNLAGGIMKVYDAGSDLLEAAGDEVIIQEYFS